jgi:deoxyhypusine synthase
MDFNDIEKFSNKVLESFNAESTNVTKQEIEDADGRKERSAISDEGSVLYIAYENENPLYVGETGKSIKKRFISNKSGSHKVKNATWYVRMTNVKFTKIISSDSIAYRKLLEQALSIAVNPEFYG